MNKFKIAGLSLLAIGAVVLLNSCSVKVPENIEVVDNFEIDKYMGEWYEIARFDFKFQKDMSNVTANYTLNEDGSVTVVNKGYNYVKNKWQEVKGKAKFNGDEDQGALKVSFFGPFYSGYNVVAMDPDYENVLIFGRNTDYVWMLSRNKTMPKSVKDKFLAQAKSAGYDLNRLVWTEHNDQK